MKSTFRAVVWDVPAQEWQEFTAETFALKNPGCRLVKHNGARMTAETRAGLVKADRVPPRDTEPGQKYDRKRAMAYFEAMTGLRAEKVEWAEKPIHGEKKPRVCTVLHVDEFGNTHRWPVPHWDWNGHNQPIAECELFADLAAA